MALYSPIVLMCC